MASSSSSSSSVVKCMHCPNPGIRPGGTLYALHDGSIVCNVHARCCATTAMSKCTSTPIEPNQTLVNIGGVLVHPAGECNRCSGCGEQTAFDLRRKSVNGRLFCSSCDVCPGCSSAVDEGVLVAKGVEDEWWHRMCVFCEMCGTSAMITSGEYRYEWAYRRMPDGSFNGIRCTKCLPCEMCPMVHETVKVELFPRTMGGGRVFVWAHPDCYTNDAFRRNRSERGHSE